MGTMTIKSFLQEYESCSGQLVNFEKSLICFSLNVNKRDRQLVEGVLGVRCSLDLDKYLGLPMVIGRNKKVVFRPILDNIRNKINGWCNR